MAGGDDGIDWVRDDMTIMRTYVQIHLSFR